jgi:hypothetical protein
MVDGIIWFVLGLVCGCVIGINRASVTRERLYYQNQLKDKDKAIELLDDRLKKCQKWSKVLADENDNLRRKNV